MLASLDEAHETLSGPATQKLLQRACYNFHDGRLPEFGVPIGGALVSVASESCLPPAADQVSADAAHAGVDRGAAKAGAARAPGYLRIDTVHQGDQDGTKGVYHINAVDEVTQWEVVGAVAQISEAYLLPVLEAHAGAVSISDSGFSFRQRQRVHQSPGSGTAEKATDRADQIAAAAFQRQRIGGEQERRGGAKAHGVHAHCHGRTLRRSADFYEEHFNPYLNFHRPCGVPELMVNAKGKEKRVYRWYATPWEILRQLPDVARHLKAEVTIAMLDQQAQAKSDTEAAEEMQEAKCKLFGSFQGKSREESAFRRSASEVVRSYEPKPKHPLKENQGSRGVPPASRWSASELENPIKKGGPSGGSLRSRLQAHSSMRKCS